MKDSSNRKTFLIKEHSGRNLLQAQIDWYNRHTDYLTLKEAWLKLKNESAQEKLIKNAR